MTNEASPITFFENNATDAFKPYIVEFLDKATELRSIRVADVLTGPTINWAASDDHMSCSHTWTLDGYDILTIQVSYTEDTLDDLKMKTSVVTNPVMTITEDGLQYTSQEMLDDITKLFNSKTVRYVDDYEGVTDIFSTTEVGKDMYACVMLFTPKGSFTVRGDI